MSTLLVKNIELLATFDDGRREIKDRSEERRVGKECLE